MNDTALEPEPRFSVKVSAESHFAWLRTRLSVERTLMSWMRTATALIGFGFTMVQFFERLKGMHDVAAPTRPELPRYIGMGLIAAGTAALIISVWQYRSVTRYLGSAPFAAVAYIDARPHKTPLFAVAVFLGMIGVFAFASIALRLN
jgi:putative membrane protein